MNNEILKAGERIDDLQRNGYGIIQNPDKFCFGMDAVLLSGYAMAKAGDRVLDLGCGNGIIPILIAAKTEAKSITGLEIQSECADMARRSTTMNKLDDRVHIIEGDIKEAGDHFDAASFDVITCNPPYMINQHGLKNPGEPKAIARHEILCSLDDVIMAARKLLRPNGKFYMIHRPFRLTEIMIKLSESGLEPKKMKLVYPYVDHEPTMVLIEAVKGGKSGIKVEKPLVIYKEQGKYTDEIYDIYGY